MENNLPTAVDGLVADSRPQEETAPPLTGEMPRQKSVRSYTPAERVLLPIALLVAVLFDRTMAAGWGDTYHISFFSAIFWLSFLVVYYACYWKKLKSNRSLWLVGGLTALLCIWNFLFDYRSAYGSVTFLVIPAVLMAHTQFLSGGYKLKEVGRIAIAWLLGWLIKPFSGIGVFFGAAGTLFIGEKKTLFRNILVAVCITLPLMLVLIPLLGSADMVFAYYMKQILWNFSVPALIGHLFLIAIALLLFYSFLWNIGQQDTIAGRGALIQKEFQIDNLISCIVLGSVTLLYLLFCFVQFTYLFAGAGLPGGMTYSEYAREGFAQMIVICAINLLIFGVFVQYGKRHRAVMILLYALLALTAVMLVSSFLRLALYIDTYGLTWLRLLSGWFILYLAVVLILCGVRVIKQTIPLIAVCAFLLLGWYVVLGFANPDAAIVRYNLRTSSDNHVLWVESNRSYVGQLSDNALLALRDEGVPEELIEGIAAAYKGKGYSLSSHLLRSEWKL